MATRRLRLLTLLALAVSTASSVELERLQVKQCDTTVEYAMPIEKISGARLGGAGNDVLLVSGAARASRPLETPLRAEVAMTTFVGKKDSVRPVTVECSDDGAGSCTFDHDCRAGDDGQRACGFLAKFGLPCQCPIPEGEYSFQDSEFPLKIAASDASSAGMVVNITHNGQQVSCYRFLIKLKDN